MLHVGIGDGSSDGLEDGLSLGVELYQVRVGEGSLVGFQDGLSLGVELGIDDGSSDGFEDGVLVVVQDGAVEGVVVGESLVDGLADFAVLADFTLRRFVLFPPVLTSTNVAHSSRGFSLRECALDKRRKH